MVMLWHTSHASAVTRQLEQKKMVLIQIHLFGYAGIQANTIYDFAAAASASVFDEA